MSRHVNNIVDTSSDPDIPVIITSGTVTSKVISRVWLQMGPVSPPDEPTDTIGADLHICFQIPLVILPDGSRNRRPWALQRKYAFDSITREECSFLWLQNARLNAKEWHSGTARFGWNGTRERGNDDGACFSLPEGVDDSAFFLSNVLIVPMPCFRIDGFADRSEDPQ